MIGPNPKPPVSCPLAERPLVGLALAALALAAFPLAAAPALAGDLSGTAEPREPVALPPDAGFEAVLIDTA
ncbi:MAG: hypothetical protein ACK4ZO_09895, partial [Cyanobacteriota bacterium]